MVWSLDDTTYVVQIDGETQKKLFFLRKREFGMILCETDKEFQEIIGMEHSMVGEVWNTFGKKTKDWFNISL